MTGLRADGRDSWRRRGITLHGAGSPGAADLHGRSRLHERLSCAKVIDRLPCTDRKTLM